MKMSIPVHVLLIGLLSFALIGCGDDANKSTAKKEIESKPLMSKSKTEMASKDAATNPNGDNGKPGDQPQKDGGKPLATKDATKSTPTKDGDIATKNAKALKDPNVEPEFVDPNNPNFIPPDRKFTAEFNLKDLVMIGGDDKDEVDPTWVLASHIPALGGSASGVGEYFRGYAELPFMLIAGYDYPTNIYVDAKPKEGEPPKKKPEIPSKVRSLNMRNVAIKGYMMPIDFEDGGTNEFILSRVIPSCFYCQPPQLNDWVEVRMKGGKRVPYSPDSPIVVYGRFEVGEMLEDGFVVNLYRVEADKMNEVVEP